MCPEEHFERIFLLEKFAVEATRSGQDRRKSLHTEGMILFSYYITTEINKLSGPTEAVVKMTFLATKLGPWFSGGSHGAHKRTQLIEPTECSVTC